jgi:hypothetical protein
MELSMSLKLWPAAMVLTGLVLTVAVAQAYEKVRTGGVLGNNFSSTMVRVDDTTMRVTTRKQAAGDLAEVNRPGTPLYNSLVAVQNAAAVRAAVEARALGYSVLAVLGSRDLTSPHELAVEIVVRGVPGASPPASGGRYLDVSKVLKQFGIE